MARVGGRRTHDDSVDDDDDVGGDVARRSRTDRRQSDEISTTCFSVSAKRYAIPVIVGLDFPTSLIKVHYQSVIDLRQR